jgi:hypothetical protein
MAVVDALDQKKIAQLIRWGDHDAAERVLQSHLSQFDDPLADICRVTTTRSLSISGWDQVNTTLQQQEKSGEPYTAICFDISNHADLTPTPEGWSEPDIEVSYYSDESYPFSTSTHGDVIAACEQSSTPWQGCFEDIDHPLNLKGLAQLNTALQKLTHSRHRVPETSEQKMYQLASWFRTLRFHQTVKRYIDTPTLVVKIPMLVGSNEVDPFLTTVYFPAHQAVASESDLRKRLQKSTSAETGIEKPRGFLDRFFGRS